MGEGKAPGELEVRKAEVWDIKSTARALVQELWTRARRASLASLQPGTWHM